MIFSITFKNWSMIMSSDYKTIESPGKYLERKFLIPYGLSHNKVARDLDISPSRINDLVRNRRGISADTALRLARYFNTEPKFWLEMQMAYDLAIAQQRSGKAIEMTVRKGPNS